MSLTFEDGSDVFDGRKIKIRAKDVDIEIPLQGSPTQQRINTDDRAFENQSGVGYSISKKGGPIDF
ncbi:MAG TPA: hypothetical protein VNQ97_11860 [Burkholderiaceae bacterium]|nr:hypothetical protein [Burkholderiaceae bacterium]